MGNESKIDKVSTFVIVALVLGVAFYGGYLFYQERVQQKADLINELEQFSVKLSASDYLWLDEHKSRLSSNQLETVAKSYNLSESLENIRSEVASTLDSSAARSAIRNHAAEMNKKILENARQAIEIEDIQKAVSALYRIPNSSPLHDESMALIEKLQAKLNKHYDLTRTTGSLGMDDSSDRKDLWVIKGEGKVRSMLKDSASAKFKGAFFNRAFVNGTSYPVSCGWVNSKNSFGAYGGFQRYVAAGEVMAFLEEQVTDFDVVWNTYCK